MAAATVIKCPRPWLLGDGRPATHAYVGWGHGDEEWYRVDAQSGGAAISSWRGPAHDGAHWRLEDALDLRAGFRRALALVGTHYDGLEFVAQVAPDIPEVVRQVGAALGVTIPHVATYSFLAGAVICTSLVTEVLLACGGPAVAFVGGLRDRYPETLAQGLQAAIPQGWLRRV